MPKINKFDKGLKQIAKIATHATAIVAVIEIGDKVIEEVKKLKENQIDKIDISAICPKSGHSMTVDEAKDYLQKSEVKASYIPIKPSEAKPEYRDCFEFQVVDVDPSTKIASNEVPRVYYVTRKVIDKSQQLFEELEQQRIIAKEEKQSKRSERKEKAKQAVINTFGTAKREIQKVPTVLHKKNKVKSEQDE